MRLFGTIMLVLLALAGPAWADEPAECRVAEHLVQNPFPLPRASKALEAKRLDILVLGGECAISDQRHCKRTPRNNPNLCEFLSARSARAICDGRAVEARSVDDAEPEVQRQAAVAT